MAAERYTLRATVVFQDYRLWGVPSAYQVDHRNTWANTGLYVGSVAWKPSPVRATGITVGRQSIVWGDGRLLGASDWSAGRTLDAIRGQVEAGSFEVDSFASILTAGAASPQELNRDGRFGDGTGAQLYGVRAGWAFAPLLRVDWNNLLRVVRAPTMPNLPSGELLVSGVRVSGDYAGLIYGVEGAYEWGRRQQAPDDRSVRAYAAAARIQWVSSWFWKLGFEGQAAYATGDPSARHTHDTGFSPVLPDDRIDGITGLVGWSNLIALAGSVRFSPLEDSVVAFGYRYAALAEPTGVWLDGSGIALGQNPAGSSRTLGHQLDASVRYVPWKPLRLEAGYSAFVLGAAGQNFVRERHRDSDLLHFGYLQATLDVP